MTVVYLNSCAQLGGAETSLLELLAAVRARRPDWKLHLILGESGPLIKLVSRLGVKVHTLPFPTALGSSGDSGVKNTNVLDTARRFVCAAVRTAQYSTTLRTALCRLSPDLIHSTGFKMHVLSAMTRPVSIPLIWHMHDYIGPRPVLRHILRRLAFRCDAVIANSESVMHDVRKQCPSTKRIATIYNAIDLERFTPAGRVIDLDAAGGAPAPRLGTVRVGLIATFARWKGHDVFLRAMSVLNAEVGIPIRGYIVGGPIYRTSGSQYTQEELERRAEELGVRESVVFTGFLPEVSQAMRALDIVVHASTDPEPFGMIIAEAMACRRVVVVSRAGGAMEIANREEVAMTHAPGDAVELAAAIRRLAEDSELRKSMAAAGAESVTRFSRTRLAMELETFYERVCP